MVIVPLYAPTDDHAGTITDNVGVNPKVHRSPAYCLVIRFMMLSSVPPEAYTAPAQSSLTVPVAIDTLPELMVVMPLVSCVHICTW